MRVTVLLGIVSVCCFAQRTASNRPLTNDDVVTLLNAGFSEQFVLERIAATPTKFDTSAEGLAKLGERGVSERIVRVMGESGPASAAAAVPKMPGITADGRMRVFVEASNDSWHYSQTHPQTAEVIKTFDQNCRNFILTRKREEAVYIVTVERESAKWVRRDNKMFVYDWNGDVVYSNSTRNLGNAVREFCRSVVLVPVNSDARANVSIRR